MALSESEALLPRFKYERLLNQDQAGRRIVLYGSIDSKPGLLIAERAAFASDDEHLSSFSASLSQIKNLGDNDIYKWYLASTSSSNAPDSQTQPSGLKINLIYPCTESHIKKYNRQRVRSVTETPAIYKQHILPWIEQRRAEGRLNWVYNILDGKSEQENVMYRFPASNTSTNGDQSINEDAFVMVPDLNWDRETLGSLHLLALVQRRDIWSVRDLRKKHVPWLRHMRTELARAVGEMYKGAVEEDEIKFYCHYQPTYHHFHIHIVHVSLEAGATQSVGKALSLDNIISQLDTMAGGEDAGMSDVDLTYTLGEESELWTSVFAPLKTRTQK